MRRALALAVCLLSACNLWSLKPPLSQTVFTEGRASLNPESSIQLAREQALQNARRDAYLLTYSKLPATAVNPQQQAELWASGALGNGEVLEEKVVGDTVKVRLKLTLSGEEICRLNQKKRLIVTAFPLVEPAQLAASETQDLPAGMARELSNLLLTSNAFQSQDATQFSLYTTPRNAPELGTDEPYQPSRLMQLAQNSGAHLVLSGVIRDLQLASGDYIVGSGPIGVAQTLLHEVWSRRGISFDIYIHDGLNGALLFEHRYSASVSGDVWLPASYAVGSEGFNATTTGAKITELLTEASADIQHALSCYPFATRISKIEGDTVFIDAGAQNQLRAGERLIVYSDDSGELPLNGSSHYLPSDKRPIAVLTLRDIRPGYAMGNVDIPLDNAGIQIGDWVKAW